ncbi:unnamed protein product [Arabidopsis thaliana]|uniref:RNase H type-1 domain-containing protein n=1 Tax=Arabidopsis thaliana TaxID=3702 RepID=A0A5S9WYD5_ARATH|nr:unnamed protein product [Arabidopsis thaliana]
MEFGMQNATSVASAGCLETPTRTCFGWMQGLYQRLNPPWLLRLLRWAVLSLSRLNYRKVIFESDSQQLVSILVDNGDMPTLDPIIQDIKFLLQHFEETKFVFMHRGGNGVADRIAKESLSLENYDPKLYSIVPNWVKSFMELDKL